ncbi:MAG: hypothetical protein K6E18_03825 [Lachnospiraceae bacterium]|nr:hypothetical protein [Lachnospiraceae bacterium]
MQASENAADKNTTTTDASVKKVVKTAAETPADAMANTSANTSANSTADPKRRWIELLAFLVTVLVIMCIASWISDPIRTADYRRLNERDIYVGSALLEPENSIDLAVLGDSEAMVLISPAHFAEAGISAYIIGQSGQSTSEAYYALKRFCKKQDPKVILFEPDTLVDDSNGRRELIEVFDASAYELFPILRHHGTWKIAAGLAEPKDMTHFRGFAKRMKVKSYEGGAYMAPSDRAEPIPFLSRVYMDKICRLCKKEGIEMILVSAPAPLHFTYEKHNAIAKLAEEEGLTYIDFNLMQDEIGLDWAADMLDGGDHVNMTGSVKMSEYLIPYLKKRFDLPDRRRQIDMGP